MKTFYSHIDCLNSTRWCGLASKAVAGRGRSQIAFYISFLTLWISFYWPKSPCDPIPTYPKSPPPISLLFLSFCAVSIRSNDERTRIRCSCLAVTQDYEYGNYMSARGRTVWKAVQIHSLLCNTRPLALLIIKNLKRMLNNSS